MSEAVITWTDPKLCHYDYDLSKAWFVYFTVKNNFTGEEKPVQRRSGMNYFHTKPDRIRAGKDLVKFWKAKLEDGWSPFDSVDNTLVHPNTKFSDALEFGLSECAVSKPTRRAYKTTVGFFKAAISKLHLDVPVSAIEQQHIMLLLREIKATRGWGSKAYNKHLRYISAVLTKVHEWKAIKINPAKGITYLPETETLGFEPFTEKEKEAIREYLYLHHYRLFVYMQVIYHTGIRPKECLALKIEDVDLQDGELITIVPDLEEENSKTKKIRRVPINPFLMAFLREMNLHDYPSNYYVFGTPFTRKGNTGERVGGKRGSMRPDFLSPSPYQAKRDTVTRLWKKIIIDGLEINKNLYGAKPTGADDKIMAGIDLDSLKELYGHSSKMMTENYVTVLTGIRQKKIKELSPSF